MTHYPTPDHARLAESGMYRPDMESDACGVGMVAATGIRILGTVDYKTNRNNLFIVAVSIGFGMIPLVAPNFKMWMPHAIHPLIESGILLASLSAVALNLFFNGSQGDTRAAIEAAKHAEAH